MPTQFVAHSRLVRHRGLLRAGCRGVAAVVALAAATAFADPPGTAYIFPAGGQRGTTVEFRVGGLNLHEEAPFEMLGPGIESPPLIRRTKTIWFEGPLLPLPESQRAEDYPQDYTGSVKIAADAELGVRYWRAWTSQGTAPARKFVVGHLPEVIEQEIDGDPLPVAVTLPVTINGRIFPREDVDVWTFEAKPGESYTIEAHALRLGSPLQPRLEIRDSQGRRVAEDVGSLGGDSRAAFQAATPGTHQVRIHDIDFGGMQNYVYRLTLTAGPYVAASYPLGGRRGTATRFELSGQNLPTTPFELTLPATPGDAGWLRVPHAGTESNPFRVEIDDLPEHLEREPNQSPGEVQPVAGPAVLNGRIDRAGDVDLWAFTGKKGEVYEFDLRAARLGSPLDSVLVISTAAGQELGRSDDIGGADTDSRLQLTLPDDGVYHARVSERLASRGGPRFAYRLRISPPPPPDFRLKVASDAVTVNRAGQATLKLDVSRIGGFAGEISLAFDALPEGVTAEPAKIAANQNEVQITFKATAAAKPQSLPLRIKGTASVGNAPVERMAALPALAGEPALDVLRLAVALPTPFKVKGVFETRYAPRGAVYVRHYTLERGGYTGPLEVRLADKQFRHLQGVTGPRIIIPPESNEFDYPISLPPWMEIGRTSRAVVSATGTVTDEAGSRHLVSFSSVEQADQIILLVDPGQLSLDATPGSLRAIPGRSAEVTVTIGRGPSLAKLPVRVELAIPEHMRGVSAEPIEIPGDATTGRLSIRFAAGSTGPFNLPLVLRATTQDSKPPHVAESKVTIAPAN